MRIVEPKPVVTEDEAKALLHMYRVNLARWSNEEPGEQQKARDGIEYWDHVLSERVEPTRVL